jgi:hypothetical protein
MSLDKIVEEASHLKQVYKSELQPGDTLLINTRNSCYYLRVLADGYYQVSGGWFDRQQLSPLITTIAGCSWGGSIIKADIVAACGLCLEFGNRVITSAIQKITIIKNLPESYSMSPFLYS